MKKILKENPISRSMMKNIIMLFILCAPFISLSQNTYPESKMLRDISKCKHDSDKINCMIAFVKNPYNLDDPKSVDYALQAVDLSKKINYLPALLASYEAVGDAYWYQFNYVKSVDYYFKEQKLADSLHNKFRLAKALYNIGWIKAVQQQIFEGRYDLLKALRIFEKMNYYKGIIEVANGLGAVYQERSKIDSSYVDSAAFYFRGMIYVAEQHKEFVELNNLYSNYAGFLTSRKRYHEAIIYIYKTMLKSKAERDTFHYAPSLLEYTSLLIKTDSLKKAQKLILELKSLLKNNSNPGFLIDFYKVSYQLALLERNYQDALTYHKKFKEISDTLNMQIYESNLQEKESAYTLEKKENNIRQLQQKNELSAIRNKQNNYIIAVITLVVLLIIGLSFTLFRSNRNKQKANVLLSRQNKEIADKTEEIGQSIQYAKGIQNAILPSLEEFKKAIPQSFVIYLPKDVVSGDFYWLHPTKHEGEVLIAAADCTGHGVPGSLMSIVSIDKLNQAFFEKKLTSPAAILSFINNAIRNALKQESLNNVQKDGLDIALVRTDLKNKKLTYAGANRPLWIVRNGEILEFKATKTSIAGHTQPDQEYREQEIDLQTNDLILLFSDGYADQFGGQEGKKMMTRNFKYSVCGQASKSVEETEASLRAHFERWKGAHEQVDDVLVIGFKI